MTTITHITIPAPSETSVSRAFTILLHRVSDLVRLEGAQAEFGRSMHHGDRADDLMQARFAVLAAARGTGETPAEHPLDGSLHRLATLAELQISLHCPDERAGLYAQVIDNRDLFEITGWSAMDRHVRDLQELFFTRYAALIEGPQIAALDPETDYAEMREAIPA